MRSIAYADYYDKVYGGWIGKCIGGNIGAEVENNSWGFAVPKTHVRWINDLARVVPG